MADSHTVSALLTRWSNGDQGALPELMPLIYDELKRMAARHMRRERRAYSFQATALLNEAYLRLANGGVGPASSRPHFFALASRVMRQILIDRARSRDAVKRGGGAPLVPLDDVDIFIDDREPDVLVLDEALIKLAAFDERKAQVVEMRAFGGMDVQDVAVALGVSENTVIRDWMLARAWLRRFLSVSADSAKP